MNARLFWKSLVVQAAVLAVPFVLLALTLDGGFFEDWGWLTGPVVWLLASLVTARVLSLPLGYTLFSAAAGGVAGSVAGGGGAGAGAGRGAGTGAGVAAAPGRRIPSGRTEM